MTFSVDLSEVELHVNTVRKPDGSITINFLNQETEVLFSEVSITLSEFDTVVLLRKLSKRFSEETVA